MSLDKWKERYKKDIIERIGQVGFLLNALGDRGHRKSAGPSGNQTKATKNQHTTGVTLTGDNQVAGTTPQKISQTQNGALNKFKKKRDHHPPGSEMVIAYYTHGSLSSFPLHFLSSWLPALFF